MNLVTPAELERQMKDIKASYQPDSIKSGEAIKLMCDTLKSLGYEAGVRVFEHMQIKEWKS